MVEAPHLSREKGKKGMTKLKIVSNFKDEMIQIHFSGEENTKNVKW